MTKEIIYTYKFRLYPTREQEILFQKHFGVRRFIYNYYLAKSNEDYNNTGKSNSCFENCNHSTQLKKQEEYSWLKEVDSWCITNSLRDLDKSFQNFFRGQKKGKFVGYPQFKSKKDRYQSYRTTRANKSSSYDLRIQNNRIKLPKIGYVRFKQDREIHGTWENMTISQVPSGKYFLSICCSAVPIEIIEKSNSSIGIDVGLKEFAITSDGEHIPNPKFLYKSEKKLKRLQRQYSKKKKGSKNQEKARIKVARQHEKISNQRKDFINKLTTEIVKNHDIICCEDLNVKGMMRNHNLAKATTDVSWSEFYRQLDYKSDWHSKTFIQISRFFASSQICSCCGYKNKETKDLSIRYWICPNCGTYHDRDENAATNIKMEGLRILFSESQLT